MATIQYARVHQNVTLIKKKITRNTKRSLISRGQDKTSPGEMKRTKNIKKKKKINKMLSSLPSKVMHDRLIHEIAGPFLVTEDSGGQNMLTSMDS